MWQRKGAWEKFCIHLQSCGQRLVTIQSLYEMLQASVKGYSRAFPDCPVGLIPGWGIKSHMPQLKKKESSCSN